MGELELMMMTMMLMVIVAVMLSPSMALDHFPDRYLTEITRLWESWS